MSDDDLDRLLREDPSVSWEGHWTVLALLFAMPDEAAINTLDLRGQYFDIRTGDEWDLFFPGYFVSPETAHFEHQAGSVPLGQGHLRDWWFNPRDFDLMQRELEQAANGRWRFSGGADLVLVNVWVGGKGDPLVDWNSIQVGALASEPGRNLQSVIEAITNDLQHGLEDGAYGVGAVVSVPHPEKPDGTAMKVMIGAMGGIAAAIGKSQIGR